MELTEQHFKHQIISARCNPVENKPSAGYFYADLWLPLATIRVKVGHN